MAELGERIWRYLSSTDALTDLQTYFHRPTEFSGAHFDTLAGGGDREETKNTFTGDDIVAVGFLSVQIPWRASVALVEEPTKWELLKEIPILVDLWSDEADSQKLTADDSAGAELWAKLCELDGVAWVTAHKLMARKRPRLFPVYDKVVKTALQPHSDRWWEPLRLTLRSDSPIIDRLRDLRAQAKLPSRVSLLRVLDVVVWMAEWGGQRQERRPGP